jgi:hypothetical protein
MSYTEIFCLSASIRAASSSTSRTSAANSSLRAVASRAQGPRTDGRPDSILSEDRTIAHSGNSPIRRRTDFGVAVRVSSPTTPCGITIFQWRSGRRSTCTTTITQRNGPDLAIAIIKDALTRGGQFFLAPLQSSSPNFRFASELVRRIAHLHVLRKPASSSNPPLKSSPLMLIEPARTVHLDGNVFNRRARGIAPGRDDLPAETVQQFNRELHTRRIEFGQYRRCAAPLGHTSAENA